MKKFILPIALAATVFSGCFSEKNSQFSGDGVNIVKGEKGLSVLSKENLLGGEYQINAILSENDIDSKGNLKIVKSNGNYTIVSVASNSEIKSTDTIFTITKPLSNVQITKLSSLDKVPENFTKRGLTDVLLGDFDNDNKVGIIDFIDFSTHYATSYNSKYDISPATKGTGKWNGIYSNSTPDGKVDISDFITFAQNYGATVIPDLTTATSITLDYPSINLTKGDKLTITAKVFYSDNSVKSEPVTWSTSNPLAGQLSASEGISTDVLFLTYDDVTISASKNGLKASASFKAVAPFTGIKVHAKGYTHIWAWDNALQNYTGGTWPGVAMSDDTMPGWKVWSINNKDSINLVFTNNGLDKSPDLSRNKGEFWYSVNQWYDKNPEVDVTPPSNIESTPAAGNLEALSATISLKGIDDLDTNPKIYYTMDGTAPVTGKNPYSNPISITKDTTIKAIAVDSANNVSKEFTLSYRLGQDATPPVVTITPVPGMYESVVQATLIAKDNKDPAPKLYYTTDGTEPTTESKQYTPGTPFTIDKAYTIKVLAVDASGNSARYTFRYSIGRPVTEWDFRDETIYFAMTARFYDGDSGNNQGKKGDPAEDPSWRGDLQGITAKLDYIKAMGFTAIWITPPVQNNSAYDYHGYHASNFSEIDSRIGGMAEYKKFIDAVHSKGMKVIQDVVFNHSGPTGLSYPGGHFDLGTSAYHNKGQIGNWEGYICQTGDLAGADCSDLNTENEDVINAIINSYNQYIDMGVDAFRVDTVKHINRLIFNKYFNPAFKKRGLANGKNFYMFGEACSRVHDIWNKNVYSLSTPFYTWQERLPSSGSLTDQVKALYDAENASSNQPTSDNAFLKGNLYHEPDYSKESGLSVIDFPMHWNFSDANAAFNFASNPDNDQFYNDSTWNVVYVDSHDYGPNSDNRYAGGTNAWANNMSLMWTFRGIPCIYYGSEIEFKAGARIDTGSPPLEATGRAYYGSNLEGTVNATDFGVFTASGKVAETLNKPLVKHLIRLNKIRKEIPALKKGQYSKADIDGGATIKFKRRYTKGNVDSFALVVVNGDATFKKLPAGTYVDVITGTEKVVAEGGSLTATCAGDGNMRIYVLNGPGKIGEDGPFLK